MTPVLLRAAGGALLAAMAAAASFLPLAEASADSPAWMLHPVDGASVPGTQLSYCTSLSTDETMPEDETARWTPETVFFHVVDGRGTEVTPPPAPASGIEVPVDQKDAEILARLLWSSPLTNEDDKRRLCWLIFNRVDDERYGLFGSTVDTVVIRREFTFYDRKAHISETNLRIANEELRRWSLYLLGAVKERLLPQEYVFASFSGHSVRFYAEIGGDPFPGGESLRAAGDASVNGEAGHE